MNEENKEEIQRMIRLLSQAAQEIGEERIIEEISRESVAFDRQLIEVIKGSFEEQGIMKDFTRYIRKLLSCGHISLGRRNFGGICSSKKHNYRRLPLLDKNLDPKTPFIGCNKCMKRCIRCKKLYCIHCVTTVPSLPGVCFCKRCARWRRLGDVFRKLGNLFFRKGR